MNDNKWIVPLFLLLCCGGSVSSAIEIYKAEFPAGINAYKYVGTKGLTVYYAKDNIALMDGLSYEKSSSDIASGRLIYSGSVETVKWLEWGEGGDMPPLIVPV